MTMTETPTINAKPKRKYTKRHKAASTPKQQKVPSEFSGLTPLDCCDGCSAERCIISGINVCSHPFKGALQARQMMQPEVLKRYRSAKRALGEAKLNLREMAGT